VTAGKDKDKKGKVIAVVRKQNRVLVEGINLVRDQLEMPFIHLL
jgi:large subunit ribosomal protein L24